MNHSQPHPHRLWIMTLLIVSMFLLLSMRGSLTRRQQLINTLDQTTASQSNQTNHWLPLTHAQCQLLNDNYQRIVTIVHTYQHNHNMAQFNLRLSDLEQHLGDLDELVPANAVTFLDDTNQLSRIINDLYCDSPTQAQQVLQQNPFYARVTPASKSHLLLTPQAVFLTM